MCPVAQAWDLPAPLNIINEKVFDDDWSIADKHGTPIKNIQTTDNSWAWVDIVGFENMSIIDGVQYVNGTPRSFAIIKYDSGYYVPEDCKFVSYDVTLNIIDVEWDIKNDTTKAILHTKFVYKEWICYFIVGFGKFCYWEFYTEEIITIYTVDSPEIFNNSIDGYEITITSYNNSVTPYTLIYAPKRYNIIRQSVEYKGNITSCYNLTGLVKTNNRGTEHVRFLNETGVTLDENETITRRAEYYVINEAPLNWSQLNISVYTPYVVKNDTIRNVTIYNSKPSDFVALKPMVTLIGILASFLIGIGIATGRIQL